jgi:hypothetical protein
MPDKLHQGSIATIYKTRAGFARILSNIQQKPAIKPKSAVFAAYPLAFKLL